MLDKIKNTVFDNDYRELIKHWWIPMYNQNLLKETNNDNKTWSNWKKVGFFENFINTIFSINPEKTKKKQKKENQEIADNNSPLKWKSLNEQFKQIINLPDNEYSDNLLTPEIRRHIVDYERNFVATLTDYKSHIAPSYRELKWTYINISWVIWKTYYANQYPSYIDFLWTRDILWFYGKWDASWFLYPSDDAVIQSMLKRKATQLKAEISDATQKWITLDTEIEIEYRDVSNIREKLATREERYFETSFYMTIYNDIEEKLKEEAKRFEQKIWWFWIKMKPAIQRMDEWFNSTMPICLDDLAISRSMVTTSLAWSFPFISNDLIDNSWILYWVNLHTWSLIIFDRFSKKLPNYNSVVLATSWAWKSFTVKLEILRYLLSWIDIMVIDPENEYKWLIEKVGGTYINISVNSKQFINPFDLPPMIWDVEYEKWDLLRSQIMNLIWLISVLIWWITPQEEAIMDKAIQAAYELKEITLNTENFEWKQPPLMEDLLHMLEWMEWWWELAMKLSKYVTWTFSKLFNNYTNVDLDSWLTVFSIRDLDDILKTPCMFNVLNFIWTKVRSQKIKRLLVVDEAWIMMQHDISASFLFWLIKRARKYWLWVTTISQDIEDFVKSKYWKPIVSNSSMQILLKQSPVSIKSLDTIYWLSEAEKTKLVASNIWEWLFFAWNQHVAIKILASPYEKDFISTDIK